LASLDRYTSDQFHLLSPEVKQVMTRVNQTEANLRFFAQNPMLLRELLNQMRGTLQQLLEAPTLKGEDRNVVRAKLASLLLLEHGAGGEQYFLNAPNRTNRDEINFMLWQKKADQLGIRFTTDDIKRLIQSEFYDAFKDDREIRKRLQEGMAGFNMDRCLAAI